MGADYHFSKRTLMGVNYRNVDATGTINDIKQVGVGVTHRF
jgi:predicted porin